MDNGLLVVHILAAAIWFGTNMVQFFVGARMRKAETKVAAEWQRMVAAFGKGLYPPAVVLLVITGFGLIGVSSGAYSWTDPFVLIGLAAVIMGIILGTRVFDRRAGSAAAAYDDGDRDAGNIIVSSVARIAAVETTILILVFVAMVLKIGA